MLSLSTLSGNLPHLPFAAAASGVDVDIQPVVIAATQAPTSPITTHVLDTCLGRPSEGVEITLQRLVPGSKDMWDTVATSCTNRDGRIPSELRLQYE
jgi:hypothetical protein